ncbi:MAG: dihydrodipicolinate synthase family protein [Pseudomonadota bacterium]
MSHREIAGFVPALVTPFNTDGELQLDAFRHIAEHFMALGANGLCVAGDNGESWALTSSERTALTRIAVEVSGGRVPVIVGVSATMTQQCLAYAEDAKAAGADAVLAMPQTYVLKADRRELLARFQALATVGLPIVLYNSPRRAGLSLTIDDIEAILTVAPVVAIKESSRDFFHLTHLIARLGKTISVMTGPAHFIVPSLALGAAGFIATGPELLGAQASKLCEAARGAPTEGLAETHYRLTRIYELLMRLGTWPSALKAALDLQGLPAGSPREPVLELNKSARRELATTLADLGLIDL